MPAITYPRIQNSGPSSWKMTRDEEGHREYRVIHKVKSTSVQGPYTVLNDTPGLPQPGDVWNFGQDEDIWAWCRNSASIDPVVENAPNEHWLVGQTFSTKPPERGKCGTNVENPLCELPKVSGRFVKYMEEATVAQRVTYFSGSDIVRDLVDAPILNSAYEMIRGPKVEFDNNRPSVHIEFNVPVLDLNFLYGFIDHVNDQVLWGLQPRCVKLSNISWERKYYGPINGVGGSSGTSTHCKDPPMCLRFYTLAMDFDTNPKTFDRDLLDEGTKVLRGAWSHTSPNWVPIPVPGYGGASNPDPDNPTHFIRYSGREGNISRVILNCRGLPIDSIIGSPTGTGTFRTYKGRIHLRYYPETNLQLLGIPTEL